MTQTEIEMDSFSSTYDLLNGTIHSQAAFDRAVRETTVNHNVKQEAIAFEASVWNDVHLPMTVEQTGADTLVWTVKGKKLSDSITMSLEPQPQPAGLAQTQEELLGQIKGIAENYIGAAAYFQESIAFGDDLGLGAMASGTASALTIDEYGPSVFTSMLVTPTSHASA
jgi:hypothetical protein